MNAQSKAGFGFSSANETIRDLASAVKPKARASEGSPLAALAVADSVAEEVGFMSRERPRAVAVVKRSPRPRAEPMQQLAMRVPISVLQAFATFADGEGVSYPKALALLLERERERRG